MPTAPPLDRVLDRRLDRIAVFDEKSRAFPVRAAVPTSKLRSNVWSCGAYLDQGTEGACVGFSRAHAANARPWVSKVSESLAQRIYQEAKRIDEWPGENYDGTSVLAGVKVAKRLGYVTEYRWAFSSYELALGIGYRAPAVLGVNWYEGMFDTDAQGYVRATGQLAGGHAILCKGYSLTRDAFLLHNSWGRAWGLSGQAWITRKDMDKLLSERGEACFHTGRANVRLAA